jgi:hypothetical protein
MYKNRFYNLFGHFDPSFSFPIVLINGNSAGSQENHEIDPVFTGSLFIT